MAAVHLPWFCSTTADAATCLKCNQWNAHTHGGRFELPWLEAQLLAPFLLAQLAGDFLEITRACSSCLCGCLALPKVSTDRI